ncbi:N-acetyltransferase 8-like 2 isoform X1 [Pangasianodon hypophthalmus]|nr:N-acetyltransferase 8-like 2 isoform X1 [Pangasianodon hypophthalmus]XP_026787510.1 N-acetyltransferase 8-like 2 isoform X1 [Pangasianodon hypophthalmus]
MHVVIRKFQPSDSEAVKIIFQDGIKEHITSSFIYAISQPLHITLTLCFCIAGYILFGESVVLALLAGASWIGLLLYCCYEFYTGYVRLKLRTDMRDITGFYIRNPDNCFWVAEAQVNGRPLVVGMVAVEARNIPNSDGQKYGELFRMSVSSECRHAGVGSRLGNVAVDFCKERGFSKVVLQTTFPQRAAISLYIKMGFKLVQTHTQSEGPWWINRLIRVKILKMEKIL